MKKNILIVMLVQLFLTVNFTFAQENAIDTKQKGYKEYVDKKTDNYKDELETYLQDWIINQYDERAELAWHRDYSSFDAFQRSVAPNRERWRAILNPPLLKKTGPLKRTPHPYLKGIHAEWIELPLGPVTARGLIVFPEGASKDNPVPLVIAGHGIGSSPESPFEADNHYYNAYGLELLKAGYAVFSPHNLPTKARRNYIERLCRLINTTLPGIEFSRMQHLLDVVLEDPRIDKEKVGMWGVSLGGMATMFWTPLEPRIKVAVVSAWFNHRLTKMALPDDKYVSFLVCDEEHAFFRGWTTEFADYDVASLICPRPLLVQHGKKDLIGYWKDIQKEFDVAKTHYEKLGVGDRIQIEITEGGHSTTPATGVNFLNRWLKGE